jgi:hypothetical protein
MAQVKVYGIASRLDPVKNQLSEVIHSCTMDALMLPTDKRAHRFFSLRMDDMFMPGGRSEAYTIIEVSMIAGRTIETRKKLIRLLFDRIRDEVGIQHMDLEICIQESPACNWGFRGMHGDEINLGYDINV